MGDTAPFEAVELPDPTNTPFEEWDATQRRGWMLKEMRDAGHPRPFVQADIARQFGVSEASICKDVKKIHRHIADEMGEAKVGEIARIVETSVYDVFEDDDRDPMDAIDAAEKWFDLLAEYGAVERAPEKREVEQDIDADVNTDVSFDVTWDTVSDGDE